MIETLNDICGIVQLTNTGVGIIQSALGIGTQVCRTNRLS